MKLELSKDPVDENKGIAYFLLLYFKIEIKWNV